MLAALARVSRTSNGSSGVAASAVRSASSRYWLARSQPSGARIERQDASLQHRDASQRRIARLQILLHAIQLRQ